MPLPEFLRFKPVPVRARHDGWTPRRQRLFILALARGAGPDEAARQLGKSRQTVYALRAKPGSESFARAWDAAMDFADEARSAARAPTANQLGLEPMLVPRYYRGRLIGFVQREEKGRALRVLGQLDRVADRVERSGVDPEIYFEALERFEDMQAAKADKADEKRA